MRLDLDSTGALTVSLSERNLLAFCHQMSTGGRAITSGNAFRDGDPASDVVLVVHADADADALGVTVGSDIVLVCLDAGSLDRLLTPLRCGEGGSEVSAVADDGRPVVVRGEPDPKHYVGRVWVGGMRADTELFIDTVRAAGGRQATAEGGSSGTDPADASQEPSA